MYCEGEHEKIGWRVESHQIENCNATRVETNMTGFNLEDNVNHFRLFQEAIQTCFWSLFDPGHPEVIGCTQVQIINVFKKILYFLFNRVLRDILECFYGPATRLGTP